MMSLTFSHLISCETTQPKGDQLCKIHGKYRYTCIDEVNPPWGIQIIKTNYPLLYFILKITKMLWDLTYPLGNKKKSGSRLQHQNGNKNQQIYSSTQNSAFTERTTMPCRSQINSYRLLLNGIYQV